MPSGSTQEQRRHSGLQQLKARTLGVQTGVRLAKLKKLLSSTKALILLSNNQNFFSSKQT